MITSDMIPDQVWHTAMSTYHKTIKKRPGSAWQEAIAAALNAWPNQNIHYRGGWEPVINNHQRKPQLILPLPQENPDDQG